jgi:hypothetical protein
MGTEIGSDATEARVGLLEPHVTPVEPPSPPSLPAAARRRRRWPLILGLVVVLLLALAGGAYAANSSLSKTYSAQRAVTDYFAAQQRGDVNAMWSRATYARGDDSFERLFNQAALRAMMQLPANSNLRDVRITSARQVDNSTSLVGVSLVWNGTPRDLTFTVRKDPSASHWLFYQSWKVEIPYSTLSITLPNQPGTIVVDGIYPPPGVTLTSIKVMFGFHQVTMLETPLLDPASQQVDAVGDTPIAVTGTISKSAIAKAGEAVTYAFSHCTGSGCFDQTYTAPDNNFIYYMTLPGYGNIDFTKYVITMAGDPTATMKLTILADAGKVSVSGECASTWTIDGRRQYQLKGDFSGTLTWTGGGFTAQLG